ncbi:acetoin dehydrogenase [Caryophanon tenue]|uniref:Acetoin dehydrogenase n=1 Tax=Caryophanon tenue TaxID=33978 RepID=A0A1C0YMD3_9BACL|nr:acetoin dehydrogenase [Caryophanon tenue]OCS88314.1 acetoin dehydrogenase [Caryophanon tenue]
MEHIKTFYSKTVETSMGPVTIEGPVSPDDIASYTFHEGLKAFRPPEQQQKALIGIAALPEGRIIVARQEQLLLGYVTYLYPDPLERWAQDRIDNMIELGAIEVVNDVRGGGVGRALLDISFADEAMEDYLVITTEYYWHWDLKGTNRTVWEYRKMMERMMKTVNFEEFATDDPEINSHPANCLMARIGKNVQTDTLERFDRLRFRSRFHH